MIFELLRPFTTSDSFKRVYKPKKCFSILLTKHFLATAKTGKIDRQESSLFD